ncbi:hypothetical protein [Micromonospora sp. MA102]|nr:hypothetical protein [Micromonospora sp. MA102]
MTFYEWRTNPSSFIAAFTSIIGSTPGRYQANRRSATCPGR